MNAIPKDKEMLKLNKQTNEDKINQICKRYKSCSVCFFESELLEISINQNKLALISIRSEINITVK